MRSITQLAKYSFSEGTKYGVLTNGATWVLIRSFEEGTNLTERIVWKTDIENEELPVVLRKITTISRDNIEQIEMLVKKVQILDEIWQSLLDAPEEMINGLMPVVKSLLSQGYPDYHFEDTEIGDLLKERIKEIISGPFEEKPTPETYMKETIEWRRKPRRMKLKGEIFQLSTYKEILVNTANWLIKNGKLKLSDSPLMGGRKWYLINKEPKHIDGSSFFSPQKLSNGLWIETNYSAAKCISQAKNLLIKFGISTETLIIE